MNVQGFGILQKGGDGQAVALPLRLEADVENCGPGGPGLKESVDSFESPHNAIVT